MKVEDPDTIVRVTVSIGIARSGMERYNIDHLLALADERLYLAKPAAETGSPSAVK